MSDLGVVVIGRNEGERLRRSLKSVVGPGLPVVYVDSGSTDDSVDLARSMGVEVIELDLSLPFTAARARNAGVERLLQLDGGIKFVQLVDGDSEVISGWLDHAHKVLKERPDVAVLFGVGASKIAIRPFITAWLILSGTYRSARSKPAVAMP